jgi:hypothetical protein
VGKLIDVVHFVVGFTFEFVGWRKIHPDLPIDGGRAGVNNYYCCTLVNIYGLSSNNFTELECGGWKQLESK